MKNNETNRSKNQLNWIIICFSQNNVIIDCESKTNEQIETVAAGARFIDT